MFEKETYINCNNCCRIYFLGSFLYCIQRIIGANEAYFCFFNMSSVPINVTAGFVICDVFINSKGYWKHHTL